MKVMTIVGTRPELIRLACVIKALDRYFDHVLVHTGQNWDIRLRDIFFEELEIRRPDHFLAVVGSNLGETMGNIIAQSYQVLVEEKPDALLILGDTNSALSVLSAKRLKIPIFHMEAGNRCFDQNVPEEINRKIVDHVSDVNLPYTEHSRRNLLSEGIRKDHIFVTGSPMTEVIKKYQSKIDESIVLLDLGLLQDKYILVSTHREENIDDSKNFGYLIECLNKVAEEYQLPVIYSTHPRTQNRIDQNGISFHSLIRILRPFGFFDYNHLQKNAFCVLSDSGTLSEESAILGFPGVLIRTSTERPEAVDQGTIIIGGITPDEVIESIHLARSTVEESKRAGSPTDYKDETVSLKVVKIIGSYTKIINKVIWKKF
jgi:UDP-N-acetyl-L-fucosamine synthase